MQPLRNLAWHKNCRRKHLLPLKTFAMSQRKLLLSIQITLDDYVAGPSDEADWLMSDDDEWAEHNRTVNPMN